MKVCQFAMHQNGRFHVLGSFKFNLTFSLGTAISWNATNAGGVNNVIQGTWSVPQAFVGSISHDFEFHDNAGEFLNFEAQSEFELTRKLEMKQNKLEMLKKNQQCDKPNNKQPSFSCLSAPWQSPNEREQWSPTQDRKWDAILESIVDAMPNLLDDWFVPRTIDGLRHLCCSSLWQLACHVVLLLRSSESVWQQQQSANVQPFSLVGWFWSCCWLLLSLRLSEAKAALLAQLSSWHRHPSVWLDALEKQAGWCHAKTALVAHVLFSILEGCLLCLSSTVLIQSWRRPQSAGALLTMPCCPFEQNGVSNSPLIWGRVFKMCSELCSDLGESFNLN